nr:hypothetical protein [Tanacetum cinerariifolium]
GEDVDEDGVGGDVVVWDAVVKWRGCGEDVDEDGVGGDVVVWDAVVKWRGW